jgi:hypothetical protein
MKSAILTVLSGALLLSGCASFEEAYTLDREFGQASQAAWDQQIANPGVEIAAAPTGQEGITAEEIIGVYNKTFAEKPTKTKSLTLEVKGK